MKGPKLPGLRSTALFTLQELLDSAPILISSGAAAADLRDLIHKEYRFPIAGLTPVRLPKDVSALSDVLGTMNGTAAYAALARPTFQVALTSVEGCRRAALVALVQDGDVTTTVIVRLEVKAGANRHAAPTILGCDARTASGRDAIADLLEEMWLEADPVVQKHGMERIAVWLSTDLAKAHSGSEERISAIGAVYGYRVEFVRDAARHVNQIKSRLGNSPPALVVIWEPRGHGFDGALASFRQASAEGDVIQLVELDVEDALVELRWALAELTTLDDSVVAVAVANQPQPGDERYYIKLGGSGAGDVMIEVLDCGHDKWGSDQRRSAPRADKGLAATVGVRAKSLHLCGRCTKHRWRARF